MLQHTARGGEGSVTHATQLGEVPVESQQLEYSNNYLTYVTRVSLSVGVVVRFGDAEKRTYQQALRREDVG